jgi:hypothetical protein
MTRSILVTVRTDSNAARERALRRFDGKPTLEHVIERVRHAKHADSVVVCTTHAEDDWIFSTIASNLGALCSQGSPDDLLDRWRGATEEYAIDFFVAVESCDLFCDPELIDLAIQQFNRGHPDVIRPPEVVPGAFRLGVATPALERLRGSKAYELADITARFDEAGVFKVEQLAGVDPLVLSTADDPAASLSTDVAVAERTWTELGLTKTHMSLRDILRKVGYRPG